MPMSMTSSKEAGASDAHAAKRRRVVDDTVAVTDGDAATDQIHARLYDYLKEAWGKDSAARAADFFFTCDVKVQSRPGAGRGMVLTRDAKPGERVLYIPRSALLHSNTLKDVVPSGLLPQAGASAMRNTALVPLVLAIYKSASACAGARASKLQCLASFMESLPQDFETVPLTWRRRAEWGHAHAGSYRQMCDSLPRRSAALLEDVHKRYLRDLAQAQSAYRSHREAFAAKLQADLPDWSEEDYLWAWLCVNSRCLYLPLGLSLHEDNFTLAPMLDMANHTTDARREYTVKWTARKGLEVHAPPRSLLPECDRSPIGAERWPGLCAGDEVFIMYGAHGNATLLSEYGFVLMDADAQCGHNKHTDVLLDAEIEARIRASPAAARMEQLLQDNGYWRTWTLQHEEPDGAHPSWRTVTVLRLLAVVESSSAGVGGGGGDGALDGGLSKWQKVVDGLIPHLTPELELRAAAVLREVASAAQADLARSIAAADAIATAASDALALAPAIQLSATMVRALAREELHMLRRMAQRCAPHELESKGAPW